MDAHAHIHRRIGRLLDISGGKKPLFQKKKKHLFAENSLDGFHHGQSHMDAKDGMVGPLNRSSTDAVVTVSKDFNAQLLVFLKNMP